MTEGHFEAIKYAYRQSKDGFILSFVVHPSDMPDELATAPIGSRFMVAFASLGDRPTREDGQAELADRSDRHHRGSARSPTPSVPVASNSTPGPAEGGAANTGDNAAPSSNTLRSTMARALCKEDDFQRWLGVDPAASPKMREIGARARLLAPYKGAGYDSRDDFDLPTMHEEWDRLERSFFAWRTSK